MLNQFIQFGEGGAVAGQNRHTTGFKNLLYTRIMPTLGSAFGMNQPVPLGAKRYIDVLNSPNGEFANGKSYMSKPKKLVGPYMRRIMPISWMSNARR